MCYHININIREKERSEVEMLFDAVMKEGVIPNYHHVNGFQRPELLIITQEEPNVIQKGIWSVAPPNHEDLEEYWKEKGGSVLNTRDDSLFSYKAAEWKSDAVLEQKCIVLVTGFFEPHKVEGISYPYMLHRPDNEIFGLVGYYTKQQDGKKTFSIVTTYADDFMSQVHNAAKRMPMTLLPEDKESLFELVTEEQLQKEFTTKYCVPLNAKPVHRDILNSRIDTNTEEYLIDVFHPIITGF